MTAFAYRAVAASGRVHKGTLHAENENALVLALERRSLELIEVRPLAKRRCARRTHDNNDAERLAFAAQMADLLRAGLPFSQALELVLGAQGNGGARDVLTALEADVRAGAGITQAFERQEGWLDPVALGLLQAGERSGNLPLAFTRLQEYLEHRKTMRETMRRAVRYPLFLVSCAGASISFMMLWVVPQITGFLENQGGTLPLATRLLMACARNFSIFVGAVIAILLGASLTFLVARRFFSNAAETFDKAILHLPFFGALIRKTALARFMGSLAMLQRSGMTLSCALEVCVRTLGNKHLEARARAACIALSEGFSFAQALAPLLPPLIVRTIEIGEKGGALAGVLDETARSMTVRVKSDIDAFLGALEPALTLGVGAVLAWVVLAVLGPLYGSLGQISGGL